jgi:hypothetical protein
LLDVENENPSIYCGRGASDFATSAYHRLHEVLCLRRQDAFGAVPRTVMRVDGERPRTPKNGLHASQDASQVPAFNLN